MEEIKKQYEEFLKENELEDSIESINKFIMNLHYEIMDNALNDEYVEEIEEKISKILNEK